MKNKWGKWDNINVNPDWKILLVKSFQKFNLVMNRLKPKKNIIKRKWWNWMKKKDNAVPSY
jgi:hypothetical protein